MKRVVLICVLLLLSCGEETQITREKQLAEMVTVEDVPPYSFTLTASVRQEARERYYQYYVNIFWTFPASPGGQWYWAGYKTENGEKTSEVLALEPMVGTSASFMETSAGNTYLIEVYSMVGTPAKKVMLKRIKIDLRSAPKDFPK